VPDLEPEAHRAMLDHAWPGNVRELENALERAMVLARGGVIRRSDLPHSVRDSVALNSAAPALRGQGRIAADLSLKKHAGAAEGEAIRAALQRTDGNRRQAAALLGISVRTLFYKLKELGITET
jgi:DNA-binding NtrC family response regulator